MKPEAFFDKFQQLADSSNAAAKLRELVLDLALQGKLAEQRESDPSVETLLRAVYDEKVELVNGGLLKKAERVELPPDDGDAIQVPANWKLVTLAALCVSVTDGDHLPPPKTESGVPFLVISNVRWGGIDFDGCRHVAEEYYEKLDWIRKPSQNDILYTLVGSFGIPVVVRDSNRFCVQRHIGILRPSKHVESSYLAYAMASRYVIMQATAIATGIAQKTVPLAGLRQITIPLPPLAEQKRIVAKVDELMALCDQLEAQQQERDKQYAALARASLTRFADAPTPANLEYLFHKSYTITPADLRKSILTLAVQGKLVSFPETCREQTVGDHIEFLNGYAFKSEWFRPEGIRLCRNANVGHGTLDWHESAFIDKAMAKEFERFSLVEGDIVLSLDRPLITTGLKVAQVRKSDLPCLLLQRVAKPVRKHEELDMSYFLLWLNSPAFVNSIDPGRSNGVPHISTRQVQSLPFVLPPLAEQRRIVAKVDQLMALVDQLEAQLAESRATAACLMEAVVAELTASRSGNPSVAAASAAENVMSLAGKAKPKSNRKPSDEFVEAVAIAQLTRALASPEYPLGRLRYTKLAYFAHRKADDDVTQRYLKKAAGPYSPWARYGGPETIALEKGYVSKAKSGSYEGLIAGDHIAEIESYLSSIPLCSAIDWAVSQLRFKKNEELELLATVDFAAVDVRARGETIDLQRIKNVIATNPQWLPKLERAVFADKNIKRALAELAALFPAVYR